MSPCPYGYWSLYFVHAEAVKCKTANSLLQEMLYITDLSGGFASVQSQLSFTSRSVISEQKIH